MSRVHRAEPPAMPRPIKPAAMKRLRELLAGYGLFTIVIAFVAAVIAISLQARIERALEYVRRVRSTPLLQVPDITAWLHAITGIGP